MQRLIVTHHAPDLDAITATWLFKTFDGQHFANARIFFVNPGDSITTQEAQRLSFSQENITNVDTGLGEFDHHQPERSGQRVCAASLVLDHLCKIHPELKQDVALAELVKFVTGIDHFDEADWPDAADNRYCFMLHELIRGHECVALHDDDSQMHFGMQCLNYAYASLKQTIKAKEIIAVKGITFNIKAGKCIAMETRNSDTVKQAQKLGFALVIQKDPKKGGMNIKARPDADIVLKQLYDAVLTMDQVGSWFYHNSGKMLINSSRKHRDKRPTPLKLSEMVTLVKEIYR